MRRREVLKLAGSGLLAAPYVITGAHAQAKWPDKPVKMIVPFAAGGATDLLARPWADALGKAFGQQFVIENRGGASGLIGAEAAFKSAPDGYTLFFTSNSTVVFQPLLRKVNFDPKKFIPVARMGDSISGFIVHPKHGFKTLDDLIKFAKANPGKLTFGSSGAGTTTHLRYEMLKFKTGIDILHVPYRGGADSITDLLAGVIDIMNEGSTLPHAKAGKLTLLNVNHFERFAEFPDVPTLTEAGIKDADVPVWFGLYAPPGTPMDIVEALNAKINEISATPDMKTKMQLVSAVPVVQKLADLQKHLDNDYKSIGDLIQAANIKIDQ
ncbi:MAG: Bug family tripartite tricarboxylate transporter substrate binding protein [Hyphomicrobiaceae bacterium]